VQECTATAGTTRKTPTKGKLLQSAEALFSRYWYETVSVNQICKEAGLSNGVYYRYYKGKEEIFRELLDAFLKAIAEDLSAITGKTVSARLKVFIDTLLSLGREYKSLVTIFREGQYRFPEYEKRLRELYVDSVRRVYDREITEAEYLYIVSGIRFLSIRALYDNIHAETETAQKLIEGGIFQDKAVKTAAPQVFPAPEHEAPENSRSLILDAATELFGSQGFYNVNVFEIAKRAGFSVGTFYIHFGSKELCLSEVVRRIGRRTRHYITENIPPGLNRTETEIMGMRLFLNYFRGNTHYYDIVREAEFVVNDTAREYYGRFENGYLKTLRKTKSRDLRTVANMLMGISHYLGIEVFFSDRVRDEELLISSIGRFLSSGISR